ncbi:MAG: type II toxin-antitoxin system HicA family toxin [Coleofasciculaceae cyanobacterium SM2_1_6]|nr:type II toxin-antitoxin system HicA family toxin [Coleofasciculaceae cyanobacterium SM2_1_6]
MTRRQKLFQRLLNNNKNFAFDDLIVVVESFGFRLIRINGSHHIFQHPDISEQINLQNHKGKAKPYQISQFLRLVEIHNLSLDDQP